MNKDAGTRSNILGYVKNKKNWPQRRRDTEKNHKVPFRKLEFNKRLLISTHLCASVSLWQDFFNNHPGAKIHE